MAWRDRLQKATFRGVVFFVETVEGSFGRRAVVHEYPLRDKPYVEDLGRRAGDFSFDGYVLGADYMAQRDALMAALDQPGGGRLVHPYKGEQTVVVLDYRVKETTAEGGMARFIIHAIEAGELAFPSAQIDTQAAVDLAATDALGAAADDFAAGFSVDGFPDFVSLDAQGLLGDALTQVRGLSGMLPTLPDLKAGFLADLTGITGQLTSLLQSPASLASAFTGILGRLPGLISDPLAALRPLRRLFAFGDDAPTIPRTTRNRTQQADNQVAVVQLTKRAAVIEASRTSAKATYPSYTEAVAVRDELATTLDQLAEQATDDRVYTTLVDLRTAVVRDLTRRGADLARVVRVTMPATLPALACAYSLYEDASRADDLAQRNAVLHPSFVPGGRALEVLADV